MLDEKTIPRLIFIEKRGKLRLRSSQGSMKAFVAVGHKGGKGHEETTMSSPGRKGVFLRRKGGQRGQTGGTGQNPGGEKAIGGG